MAVWSPLASRSACSAVKGEPKERDHEWRIRTRTLGTSLCVIGPLPDYRGPLRSTYTSSGPTSMTSVTPGTLAALSRRHTVNQAGARDRDDTQVPPTVLRSTIAGRFEPVGSTRRIPRRRQAGVTPDASPRRALSPIPSGASRPPPPRIGRPTTFRSAPFTPCMRRRLH
jgi:hypothetical protein